MPANLAVAAGLVLLALRSGLDLATLGLQRSDARSGLAWGAGASLIVAAVIAVAVLVPASRGFFEDDRVLTDNSFNRWFVPVVRIPLGTALFEEVLFRSVLLGALLTLVAPWRAAAISACAFGVWHIVPALEAADGSAVAVLGEVLGIVVVTTVAGMAFAALRLWSGSVVAPTLAHVATNSFAYAAALVALEVLS
ncbi:MAG: CPBP family intramembrane glutamic endopeptidase [Acidimicrobiia bacterium]